MKMESRFDSIVMKTEIKEVLIKKGFYDPYDVFCHEPEFYESDIEGYAYKIHEGKVVEKYICPEHTYTWYSTIPCGKTFILIPHTGIRPEQYVLRVKGFDGKDSITEDFTVPINEFNCENVGCHFNDTMPCAPFVQD